MDRATLFARGGSRIDVRIRNGAVQTEIIDFGRAFRAAEFQLLDAAFPADAGVGDVEGLADRVFGPFELLGLDLRAGHHLISNAEGLGVAIADRDGGQDRIDNEGATGSHVKRPFREV